MKKGRRRERNSRRTNKKNKKKQLHLLDFLSLAYKSTLNQNLEKKRESVREIQAGMER